MHFNGLSEEDIFNASYNFNMSAFQKPWNFIETFKIMTSCIINGHKQSLPSEIEANEKQCLHDCSLSEAGNEHLLKPLRYFSLFQYSTTWEKTCIVLGIILAILSGCVPPIVNVLYGEFCNLMIDRQFPSDVPSTKTFLLEWFGGGRILQNASNEERRVALEEDSVAWGLGCSFFTLLQFLSSVISVFLLNYMAARQISRIKVLFFKSVMCKDMAWFDTQMDGNFVGKVSDNMRKLEAGIGGVIAIFTYLLVIFGFGVIIPLLYGWKLTLAIISTIPISFGTSSVVAKVQSRLAVKEMNSYAKAGTVAEEVFTSIRTVVAFEGENKEIERYSKNLEESKKYGIKRGIASGIGNGLMWFVIYCSYAVAFVLGVRLILHSRENGDTDYTPAVLLIVFFGIVTALTNMGFAAAHIETFSLACGAAASVFEVINTKSRINPCTADGLTSEKCTGAIEFRNVHFEYPSRSGVKILRGLNLKINAGEIVAIVGGSGAGKSTILQLVQRLYDPSQGEISLDGQKLKSLKVCWLREQLGVVGQEPLLFGTTIRENILYGRLSATDEDVIEAAKNANAHDFIVKLNDGYNTVIGQKGSTLSGGQKQRIAIARALIRNPKILLLDEATSALDTTSEKIVQAALDKAARGRTTLIVTHKLSTITNADRIIVLSNGVVAEDGTHDELLRGGGLYKQLLESQQRNVKEKKKPVGETTAGTIAYDDTPLFPSGPRGRFSSLADLGRGPKDQSLSESPCKSVNYLEIIKWAKPEWGVLFLGSLASIIGGAALPAVCVLFGSLFGLLSLTDKELVLKQTDFYGIILVIVGVTAGICMFLQMYCFAMVGMKLTTRLRVKAFRCMIYQEIGFFDDDKNKVGALCLRLSQDPAGIQGTVGTPAGVLVQAFSTMTIGIILSFFFNWKITLVTLATIPFVFGGVAIESIFESGINSLANESMENASKIAVEVISNIKAVASLGRETFFTEKYAQAVKEGKKNNIKKSWLRGFAFAVGQTAPFFGYAVTLWYGGILVANENLHYKYVIMVSELLIFGAWTLGQCVVLAPSFGEAKAAAGRLNFIFLRKSQVPDGEISAPPTTGKDGFISYSKVNFAYPTRATVRVLQDFSANIKAGQSVAVVGPSGSGKSTVVQLLQRLYDPTSGSVRIGNVNIRDYKLSSLRKTLGLVSQEPVLFDRTIQENIGYGDNSRVVTLNEVIEAAEAANIHSFITSLPLGYDTRLGAAGTQLSGGQKQRIAIARALVRNPEILILDEATSALDPQSESVVQDALDRAASGRTTITIGHRLGAVKNADVIYVLDKGTIKELGTHEQLMNRRGIYHSMHGGDDEDEKRTNPGTSAK